MPKKEKADTREGSAKTKTPPQCAETGDSRQLTPVVRVRGADLITDSLTIAQEFGRAHKNVLASIDSLIGDGTLNELDFKPVEYRDAKGEMRRSVELTEHGALVAMPFIGGVRARQGQVRLVDAFFQLRARVVPPSVSQSVPQSLADALRLAASLAERCERLEGVAQQTQSAVALERLAAASGSMNITTAAKSLKIKPASLFDWLARAQWIYRRSGGRWTAYQVALMRGVLEHRTSTIMRDDGSDKAVAQVLVTPKGLAELARKLPPEVAQERRQ